MFDFLQVRRLEAQGLPTKQAEAITSTITEVLNDSLENVAQSFMSKSEMDKVCDQLFEFFTIYYDFICKS